MTTYEFDANYTACMNSNTRCRSLFGLRWVLSGLLLFLGFGNTLLSGWGFSRFIRNRQRIASLWGVVASLWGVVACRQVRSNRLHLSFHPQEFTALCLGDLKSHSCLNE